MNNKRGTSNSQTLAKTIVRATSYGQDKIGIKNSGNSVKDKRQNLQQSYELAMDSASLRKIVKKSRIKTISSITNAKQRNMHFPGN